MSDQEKQLHDEELDKLSGGTREDDVLHNRTGTSVPRDPPEGRPGEGIGHLRE
jgi:hypothetical protein